MNLGAWLRKTPQPRIVVVDGSGGTKRIEVGNKGGKWRDMVRTIESLGASRVEALDGAGNILRALTLDDDDDDEPMKAPPVHQGCPQCGVQLERFATLLADAYERGSNAQRQAYESIFTENTKLVRLLADRLGALEMAWQKSLQTHAKLVGELAEANAAATASDDEGVLGPLVAGMLQADASKAAVANGKGKTK